MAHLPNRPWRRVGNLDGAYVTEHYNTTDQGPRAAMVLPEFEARPWLLTGKWKACDNASSRHCQGPRQPLFAVVTRSVLVQSMSWVDFIGTPQIRPGRYRRDEAVSCCAATGIGIAAEAPVHQNRCALP
jgi:hypothetical protein